MGSRPGDLNASLRNVERARDKPATKGAPVSGRSSQHRLRAASGQMPTLTVMQQHQQHPPIQAREPDSNWPAVEDHGRAVTATMQAACELLCRRRTVRPAPLDSALLWSALLPVW